MNTVVLVLMLLTFSAEANILESNSGVYYRRYLRCVCRIHVAVCY